MKKLDEFLTKVKYRIDNLTVESNAPDYVDFELDYDFVDKERGWNILMLDVENYLDEQDMLSEIISERLKFDTEREVEIYSVSFDYEELSIIDEISLRGFKVEVNSPRITILEHIKSGLHLSLIHSSGELKVFNPTRDFEWFVEDIEDIYSFIIMLKTLNTEKRLNMKR